MGEDHSVKPDTIATRETHMRLRITDDMNFMS